MIDIHAHILPFVDDGSICLEQSLQMIENEISLGVNAIVLTPHYRFDYNPSKIEVQNSFEKLKGALENKGIDIKLYLGQEVFVNREFKSFLNGGDFISINNSKYLLVEFDLEIEQDILETVYELTLSGYKPIVAHLERYFYADIDLAIQIKNLGGLIQINADSIVGDEKRKHKRFIKKLFKLGLVDFVASDVHYFRKNLLGECYNFIFKKYGKDVAERVFTENALKILNG